jgi:hypothetical protein
LAVVSVAPVWLGLAPVVPVALVALVALEFVVYEIAIMPGRFLDSV